MLDAALISLPYVKCKYRHRKYWWLQVLENLRTHFISIFMHMQTDTESIPVINVTLTLLSLAHGQAHNRSAWQRGGA